MLVIVAEANGESRLERRPIHAAVKKYPQHACEHARVRDVIRHGARTPPPEAEERRNQAKPEKPSHVSSLAQQQVAALLLPMLTPVSHANPVA
jgi:hypothetical protein